MAQDKNLADSLLDLEYRIFHSNVLDSMTALIVKKSRLYKFAGHPKEAVKELSRITTDNQTFEVLKEFSILYYLDQNFAQSIRYATQALKKGRNRTDTIDLQSVMILDYLELSKWDTARLLLENMDEIKNKELIIKTLSNPPRLKDPRTAQILQLIIPGAGQAYSGKLYQGLASAGLQSGAIIYMISSLLSNHYLSGIITGGGLWLRFYVGGAKHAKVLSARRNQEKLEKYTKRIREMILEKR